MCALGRIYCTVFSLSLNKGKTSASSNKLAYGRWVEHENCTGRQKPRRQVAHNSLQLLKNDQYYINILIFFVNIPYDSHVQLT